MAATGSTLGLALAFGLGLAASGRVLAQDAPDCAGLVASLTAIDGYEAMIPPSGPDQGWCVLDGATLRSRLPGWPNLSAERLRVRPSATEVEVELTGLRITPRLGDRDVDDRVRAILRLQSLDLRLRAVHDPASGVLTLTEAMVELSGGTRLRLEAEIRGAAGLSWTALGQGAVTRAAVDWRNDGRLLRPVMELAGEDLTGAQDGAAVDAAREALAGLVAALPAAALDKAARKALDALVAALPQGRGRLTLGMTSPDGIGAARIAVAALTGDPLGEKALAAVLEGATITADWQPGLAP